MNIPQSLIKLPKCGKTIIGAVKRLKLQNNSVIYIPTSRGIKNALYAADGDRKVKVKIIPKGD